MAVININFCKDQLAGIKGGGTIAVTEAKIVRRELA
jgi:hypothetical protein